MVLASASPRRATLLRRAGLKFKILPAEVGELHHEQLTAGELSQVNAYRKARAVAKRFPDVLVLAADTLVCLETELFGKPASFLICSDNHSGCKKETMSAKSINNSSQ